MVLFPQTTGLCVEQVTLAKGIVWHVVSQNVIEHYQKNEIVTWWCISSCSYLVEVVEKHLQSDVIHLFS